MFIIKIRDGRLRIATEGEAIYLDKEETKAVIDFFKEKYNETNITTIQEE